MFIWYLIISYHQWQLQVYGIENIKNVALVNFQGQKVESEVGWD